MSNNIFSIPPFPSQDLAKLVLGYLAEEQLMTAYDEFLQASPYLDALRNEYDRIFMTSLKNILAEYRAVKIYVETCKPFVLRRKLFQCTNLLEIVKFLVNNVDINKLHSQDGSLEKVGYSRHSFSKSYSCDVCHSLRLSNCTCRSNQSSSHVASNVEATSLEGSVETTDLSDLPGNISYNKKIVNEAEPKNNTSTFITSSNQAIDGRSVKFSENWSSTSLGSDTTENVISSVAEKRCPQNPTLQVKEHQSEIIQNIQSPNVVLNRNYSGSNKQNHSDSEYSLKIVDTDKLEIVAAVDSSNSKVIVPDSSTSENIVIQSSTSEVDNVTNCVNVSKETVRPPPFVIKNGNEHKPMHSQPKTCNILPRLPAIPPLVKSMNRNTKDQVSSKITILSDVKVDNELNMPEILKNNASTTLAPMQTLYINGTQAYQNKNHGDQTYTKDEIMAMPTIILVPASDKTKKIVPTVTQNNVLGSASSAVSCPKASLLDPLVIDISSNDDSANEMNVTNDQAKTSDKQTNDNMLIKTVDVAAMSHASLPKDSNSLAGLKTSTPHVLPPGRKSSSTPRRTSHIRVLDFTTPRRILHENLNEQEVNQCSNSDAPTAENFSMPVINKNSEDTLNKVCNKSNTDKCNNTPTGATKDKKASIKLYNWDAELRAHVYMGNGNIEKSEPRRKSKKSKRKESLTSNSTNTPTSNKHNKSEESKAKKSNDKVTPKIKSMKTRKKSIEVVKNDTEKQESTTSIVKPTINIISRKKFTEPVETEKSQNKSVEAKIDTPELEKMSLQNEIGIKLNISDILETPYKQALYDIQMDTPKFLGPDLPDYPLSDIKIMNIPTPRFLNTPKLPQNTPSSYSSRPTDYSSGGSYYKPDEQDYVLGSDLTSDDLPLSTVSKLNKESKLTDTSNVNVEKAVEGKSRPVRQCTKNISYKYNQINKDVEEKTEKSSTCSESSTNKADKKIEKLKISKSDQDHLIVKQKESKKKIKKSKTPVKKQVPKTFMKIKPRRTTPVKEVLGKGRKKSSDFSQVVPKMIADKEKSDGVSPLIVPVLTKSRRKSSTPRKLHCTKRFNSESSGITSLQDKKQTLQSSQITNINAICVLDSDSDQLPLRWSDDGSQESKTKTTEERAHLANESDDINRIKEYISRTVPNEMINASNECEGTLQADFIKRGFDIETARMIERDLLETPSSFTNQSIPATKTIPSPICRENENESKFKKSDKCTESDCSTSNNLQIVQDEDDYDDLDFAVQECNEDTTNYFTYNYDEANFSPSDQVKLKETFSMEICIENDVTVRLRAMPFKIGFEHDSKHENLDTCDKSSKEKPASPVHYDTLYTPRKAQCYELFDSTLASLDTPLKLESSAQEFETVAEIILEVEKLETDIKQKPDTKKRKRVQSGQSDETNGSKKVKPDTSYLLNSSGIQNIDIESVLSKLHGP